MTFMGVRRATTWVAALAAVTASVVVPPTAAAAATPSSPAVAETADTRSRVADSDLGPINLSGADVQTLARPVTVRGATTLGSGWSTIPLGSRVPAAVTSAVLVDVRVSGATKAGSVSVRTSGATTGVTAVDYQPRLSSSGLALVPLGAGDSIQVRSSAGAPKVEVRLAASATDFSSLRFPDVPAGTTVRTKAAAASASLRGVPATAATVVLAVTTTAAKAGTLKVWPAGTTAPSASLPFASGTSTRLMTVAPGAGTRVSVLAKAGPTTATTTVTPVAWTDQTLVDAVPARTRGTVTTGKQAVVSLRDTEITATADAALLSINAPAGVTTDIWPSTTATGTPVASVTSSGGATSVWVPLPDSSKILARVRGPKRASSAILVLGFSDDPGGTSTMLDPKSSTRFVGAADVLSEDRAARVVTFRSGAEVVPGDHLVISGDDGGTYLATATETAQAAAGTWRAVWTPAEIPEAFDDFATTYDGSVPTVPAVSGAVRRARSAAHRGLPFNVSFLEGKNWSCDTGLPTAPLLEVQPTIDLETHLDVSIGDRSFDFSVRGNLGLQLKFNGGTRVTCSIDADAPAMIPIPGTPLGITLGATGSAGIGTNIEGTSGSATLSGGVRFYAGAFYYDGETGGGHDATPYLTASSNGVMPTADLRVGVRAKVSWWHPPGVELPVNPYASLTTGMYLKLDRPDSADDPLHRNLMGPRCLDLSAGPFVQIGGGVALAFLPDVNIDVPAWEPFAETLWRGPCVGYSGTITYRVDETWDWGNCTSEYCHKGSSTRQTMVKTLEPQMADFGRFYDYMSYGAPVSQPYDWTYSENSSTRWEGSSCYGFCDGYWRCATTTSATGTGHVGWESGRTTQAWFVDGYDSPDYARATSYVPDVASFTERTTESVVLNSTGPVGSADAYCGAVGSERTSTRSPDPWESWLEAPHPHLATMPTINLTLEGHQQYHPEFTWTAQVALTRMEFNR